MIVSDEKRVRSPVQTRNVRVARFSSGVEVSGKLGAARRFPLERQRNHERHARGLPSMSELLSTP
jgi:hypothetical protein